MQMLVDLDGGGMITVFPKRALHSPSLVVLLGGAPRDELHTPSNYVFACVLHQQMYMVGRDHVVEDTEPKALLRLEQPVKITTPITRKLQEKFSLMAAVSNVPDVARYEMAVRSWHLFVLRACVFSSETGL